MLKSFPFKVLKTKVSYRKLSSFTDEDLVEYYRFNQDLEIVTMLMDRYADAIAGMSINYLKNEQDTEDFIQELYLKLVNKLKYTNIRNFRSWLLVTIKNLLVDTGRKDQIRIKYLDKIVSEGVFEQTTTIVEEEPELDQLLNSLNILNENERKCLEEIYLREKSYKETMDTHNWSFNEIRGYRDRAIRKLRKYLNEEQKQH
jgi:RNA polymerase sigma-70 factor, ECF subfamily